MSNDATLRKYSYGEIWFKKALERVRVIKIYAYNKR